MKKKEKIATEIWLDYVECELEKSFKEDLDRVVAGDPEERETVRQLKQVRSQLRDVERAVPSSEVFAGIKNKIMTQVRETTPHRKITPWSERQARAVKISAAAAVVVVLGVVFTQLETAKHMSNGKFQDSGNAMVGQPPGQNRNLYGEVISGPQGSDDFIFDAVVEKLSKMPEGKANKAIENF